MGRKLHVELIGHIDYIIANIEFCLVAIFIA